MSAKAKGVVEVVLQKLKKDGTTPYWVIVIDGKEYYDSKGVFKDKKGLEIEFESSPSDDGKITFINAVGGGYTKGGGGSRGKSPEELALQKKSFAYAYAKDQVDVIIHAHAHLVKEIPSELKYLDFLDHMRIAAAKMTQLTADDFLKKFNE
jgi:hypothetical protein